MKKKRLGIILVMFLMLMFPLNAQAAIGDNSHFEVIQDENSGAPMETSGVTFCQDTAPIFQFIGKIIVILKIVIPLVIMVLAVMDFSKAVVSNDEKALKLATGSLVNRLIMGVAIFFVPTIISLLFSLISSAAPFLKSAEECQTCMSKPSSKECKNYVSRAKANLNIKD